MEDGPECKAESQLAWNVMIANCAVRSLSVVKHESFCCGRSMNPPPIEELPVRNLELFESDTDVVGVQVDSLAFVRAAISQFSNNCRIVKYIRIDPGRRACALYHLEQRKWFQPLIARFHLEKPFDPYAC